MFKLDTLQITILEDGTIKVLTDQVSGPNHANAEQFLQLIEKLSGGESSRQRRSDVQQSLTHTHSDKEQQ